MSVREEFWSIVCRYAQYYYLLLVLLTVFVLLNLFAVLLGPPNEGVYGVALFNFVIFGAVMLGVAAVLWQCQRT